MRKERYSFHNECAELEVRASLCRVGMPNCCGEVGNLSQEIREDTYAFESQNWLGSRVFIFVGSHSICSGQIVSRCTRIGESHEKSVRGAKGSSGGRQDSVPEKLPC